jgi:hypothetical protein
MKHVHQKNMVQIKNEYKFLVGKSEDKVHLEHLRVGVDGKATLKQMLKN